MFETISEAFIQAGLEEGAVNYYPLSGQTVRLHDRSKPFAWDFPDRLTVLCRVSYFLDQGTCFLIVLGYISINQYLLFLMLLFVHFILLM